MAVQYLKNNHQKNMYYFCMKTALLFWWKAQHHYDLKKITTYFQKEKNYNKSKDYKLP